MLNRAVTQSACLSVCLTDCLLRVMRQKQKYNIGINHQSTVDCSCVVLVYITYILFKRLQYVYILVISINSLLSHCKSLSLQPQWTEV